MVCPPARQRVVIVGGAGPAMRLAALFADPALQSWEPLVAESPEHARFCSQMQTCGVLLADQSAVESPHDGVLGWLGARTPTPVLFLSESDADMLQHALAQNVRLWLPRRLVLDRPAVLAEGLRNVQQREAASCCGEAGGDCRARLERLVNLLWNALPVDGRAGWLSQRCLLERLREESVRANRHNTPLTLILAELALETGSCSEEGEANAWIAERILSGKRRSDVAGQYGTRGFMLLLPHTSEEGAQEVCRRLRHDIEQAPWRMHASFGVASYSSQHDSPKSLLRMAEEGLDSLRE